MKQILLKYMLFIVPLLIIFTLSVSFKKNIFPMLAVILPIFWILPSIRKISLLLFIAIITIIANFGYQLFVNYMIHPWFKVDPNNCDGHCFGYYMLEEPLLPEFIILNSILAISLCFVLLICKFYCRE